ncbi:tripartite motif-containing protein 16-like [Lampris incognitus]|uniref:tripartite motif-containing protein 16-like n=1 Tax=Lampris incognitus TaxID=2546036 RepID=UPI0024B5A570|nr:tripartite motif-containing protein 16-like [Lampris incognitus]
MANNHGLFDCSVCLQQLQDPVTTACGHSYCLKCINTFWDQNANASRMYSCPQCRQKFMPRPKLKKNTLLAELLEKQMETSRGDTSPDNCDASGDTKCDVCTGRKRKATKFCLVCLTSYCDTHANPHFEVPPLKKHKLVHASETVKESICCRHDRFKEIYCRTDEVCICALCVMDEHIGHDTVSIAVENSEKQRQLEKTKQEIVLRAMKSEGQILEVQQAADSIRATAWETVDDFERFCASRIQLYIHSVERKFSEMREKVGEREKVAVDCTSAFLRELKQEVTWLKRREADLNKLTQIDNPVQFLESFQALSDAPVYTSPENIEEVKRMMSELEANLKNMCENEEENLTTVLEKNILIKTPMLQAKTISRSHVLAKYNGQGLEVDPNTVAACLFLSQRNSSISWRNHKKWPNHPDRFTYYYQALCKHGLTDNHYWEVEWDGGIVEVAASYKGINRKGSGNDCCFGHNNLSWSLVCLPTGCVFWHNNIHKSKIPLPCRQRIAVCLDYSGGILSFYSISDSDMLTCLHQVQTVFTEPVYPGFSVDLGSTLKIRPL